MDDRGGEIMGQIVVVENITLDGVMQSPGSEDDTRGGFEHGGWGALHADAELTEAMMGEGMTAENAMLFGRRTYEIMQRSWGGRTDGNPFTGLLESRQKYVVSRQPRELTWINSTLVNDLAELPRDQDLVVLGSGELVRSLAVAGLVDRYTLVLHPLTLGSGMTLFGDLAVRLELERTVVTGKGVIVAFYRPGSAR
jgi:dihydrofolate reductase